MQNSPSLTELLIVRQYPLLYNNFVRKKGGLLMKKVKILLVDNNLENIQFIKSGLQEEENFEVVGAECDGMAALDKINTFHPDVVVTELILPRLDGFGLMSSVDKSNTPIFIVASSIGSDAFVSKAIGLGAGYYMLKPINIDTLKARIKELTGESKPAKVTFDDQSVKNAIRRSEKQLDERLSNIFISVGIPAHIKGYQFLREAIKMAIASPDIINSITKKLYPSIAETFNTSASKVERAIRHAIEVAWNRGKIENINTIFGIKVYSSHDKPTNGEFIALLADKMIMEGVG